MHMVKAQAAGVRADARTPIDIEDLLIWTYRDQKADVVLNHGVGLHAIEAAQDGVELGGSSACGCASVERIGLLGTRVDSGGWSAGHLHEDAETVHRRVQELSKPLELMVIMHARQADRPDCFAGKVPQARPSYNGKGKVIVRFEPWDQHRNYGWCPMSWTVSLVRIEAARFEYELWHAVLCSLAEWLKADLQRYQPLAPRVAARPWERALAGA